MHEHNEWKQVQRNISSISRNFRYASPANPNSAYRPFPTNLSRNYNGVGLLLTYTKRRGLKVAVVKMPNANVCPSKIED